MNQSKVIQGKVIYKTIPMGKDQETTVDLEMHVFEPAFRLHPKTSAIVFFFGGGWVGGTPAQFFEHCRYFASRGLVAFSAEYRVKERHGVTPRACVMDGKSAVRWVRLHADEYGIDENRVAAGGGSAGGHVAACTAMVNGVEEEGENLAVASSPNALVLFNPVLDIASAGFQDRFGKDQHLLSPLNHIRAGLPPTIIFHGEADPVVPYDSAVRFTSLMREKGNRCKLVGFPGKVHGFFNFGHDDGKAYFETVRAADIFLASLHFLDGEPTL